MKVNIFKNLSQAAVVSMIRLFGLDRTMTSGGTPGSAKPDEINDLVGQALGGMVSNPAFASIYTSYVRAELERRKQYKEYDTMEDESEVIATALDIYAEDATDMDSFVGRRVWVTSDDPEVQREANDALQKLGLEKNAPRIARNVAKYGDFFLGIHYDKDKEKARKEGVQRVDTSYYPRDVMPIVKDYKLLGYWVLDAEKVVTVQEESLKAPWDFVHFAVPGDANFITYDTPLEYEMKRCDLVEYGQSLLKAARKPYKRSKLMHDILAIARITRSPLKRVFKFQTETNNPLAQIQSLAMFKKTMEKIGGVDKLNDAMQYDELMNIMTADIYLPVGKDQKGDYSFQTIGGDVDVAHIKDLELWDNRLYMALRIPKEFLNFDTAAGDKATLLIKDVRYAKRIKKVQNTMRAGYKEFLFIHFALKGKTLRDDQLDVHMASTSVSDDLSRLDYYNSAVSTADTLVRMLDTFMVKVETDDEGNPEENRRYDREYLAYYILKYVVKLPNFNAEKFNPRMASYEEEKKEEAKAVGKFVEGNKSLVESLFKKTIGEDLREAVEGLNVNIQKDYRNGIPEDFSWNYDSLRSLCEGFVSERIKAKENGGGSTVLG